MGATLLVVLLLIGALLPRPAAEYSPISDIFDPAGATKRMASRYAIKRDSPAEGEGRPGEAGKDGKSQGDQTGKNGEGKGHDKDGKASGDRDGKDGRDSRDGKGKSGDSRDKNASQQKGKGQDKSDGDRSDQGRNSRDQKRESSSGSPKEAAKGMKEMDKGKESRSSPSSSPINAVQQVLQRVGPTLKWIVFAVLAVIVLGAILRGGLGFLANFTDWAKRLLAAWRNFWANLFGQRKADETEDDEEESAEQPAEPPLPFSAFSNPFDSGKADSMSARQLIRYTFRAVEAWACERDLERAEDETALEFLTRLGDEVPALESEAQRLGQLHARAEYARGGLPASTHDQLRIFWDRLERVVEAPLSA
jgi:hypothetical protein